MAEPKVYDFRNVNTIPGGPQLEVLTHPVTLGEGPYWDSEKQALFFVDISGHSVYKYQPHSHTLTSAYIGMDVGFIFPISGTVDEYLIGRGADVVHLIWNGENTNAPEMKIIATVDQDKPGNRLNDAKVDAKGRLWAGTMGVFDHSAKCATPEQGTLYTLLPAATQNEPCKMKPVVPSVTISNGIVWNVENTHMYYIDSPTRRIDVLDYDIVTGSATNKRPVFDFEKAGVPGLPDGMTIDSDGNLWIACWGGSRVIKVDPVSSTVLVTILFPVEKVTSVAFGDVSYDSLYVTTVKHGLNEKELKAQPSAGSLFKITNLSSRGFYTPPVNQYYTNNKRLV